MEKIKSWLKDPCSFAITLSVLTGILMMAGKITAYWLTGSTAILSDVAESIVHLFALSIATFSLWYSKQPADKEHQYGHGKIAYFSAAGEAIIILISACYIIFIAIESRIEGVELHNLDQGIFILATLSPINLLLGNFLLHTGEKYNSLVLVANGKHVLTDMWTSLGVVMGITVVWQTGIVWLDPFIAIIFALSITWTACKLLKKSFDGLMEKVDEETSNKISGLLINAVDMEKILSFHQLRHRRVNERLWIEVHLVFLENITVKEAHAKASDIEIAITKAFPKDKLYITTHMEPEHHMESHPKGHPEISNIA
jgi:cation diffusion facilitator family transporter